MLATVHLFCLRLKDYHNGNPKTSIQHCPSKITRNSQKHLWQEG
jgi:hypothetical protein